MVAPEHYRGMLLGIRGGSRIWIACVALARLDGRGLRPHIRPSPDSSEASAIQFPYSNSSNERLEMAFLYGES